MTAAAIATHAACLHCGLPVGAGGENDFCCRGCAAVYALLDSEHLERSYAFRRGAGVPVAETDAFGATPVARRPRGAPPERRWPYPDTLDVQGLRCVGCVWLVEELFRRAHGGEHVEVNPSLGRVDLVVQPDFDLRAFVSSVERFGYLFGPPVKRADAASNDLLWRLGVCAAIAMNSMIFAIAMYAGLRRGPLFDLFTALNFGFGAVAVLVGGTVFFRSAWRAVRQGMLHLDLPIALGIAMAFAGSVYSYAARRSEAAYFDTLDVFITLMLLGRWLQERVVERDRAWLLASDGTDSLLARRVVQGRLEVVPCARLKRGDALLVAPGDLVPVDARLERGPATFSLDWIVGESRPRSYEQGEIVPQVPSRRATRRPPSDRD